jgi:putative membrane protein
MMWGPYGMMGGYGWGGMGWMPFMGIFWLLVLFLLVAAAMGAFRRHGGTHHWSEGGEQRSTGLAILEERYARGEINRDEYLQKKQDILGRG